MELQTPGFKGERRILIVYASKFGQTARIAARIGQILMDHGFLVSLANAQNSQPSVSRYFNGVIVGTPIYMSRSDKKVINWVIKNMDSLNKIATGFFTVSLNAADQNPAARNADKSLISQFIERTGWIPTITSSLKGALHYPSYNFFLKFLMKRIARSAGGPTDTSKEFELTDWKEVESFALKFAQELLKREVENNLLK